MRKTVTERAVSLYVHVPFCARKCEYCAFYSHAPNNELVDRYVSALIREMSFLSIEGRPQTIFFGGGTPSLLTVRQWERILQAMERHRLLGTPEWTVECNPATISAEKARLLRAHGVNRISMGVQSLDDELLDRLGRIHTRQSVLKSFDLLRKAGFDNINLDLMFAIPGQTMELWRQTLAEATALQSEHLSCYEVIYEEDTPLFAGLRSGKFSVDQDLACDMYEELLDLAADRGYEQYEVANFARRAPGSRTEIPDRACRHNINYWRGGEFYGLGPSATGYIGGVRTKNWPNTLLYCEQLEHDRRPIESREQLAPLARAGETAAFGLRMTAGWPFDLFKRTTAFDLREGWSNEMGEALAKGWGEMDEQRFRLTPAGLRFADAIAEDFLRPEPGSHSAPRIRNGDEILVSAELS
ncbi:MAG: radical SAM family heme chaperone HemW [Verrucomicrobia bacterium]|nr:radical SAM family heme chaperone HemW [Verrucomicrobiota bacterium]